MSQCRQSQLVAAAMCVVAGAVVAGAVVAGAVVARVVLEPTTARTAEVTECDPLLPALAVTCK